MNKREEEAMHISDVYVGQDAPLLEQLFAVGDYCKEYHKDSILLAALGSLGENVAKDYRKVPSVEEIEKYLKSLPFPWTPVLLRWLAEELCRWLMEEK